MKKIIYIIIAVTLYPIASYAQIGVQTESPLQILHIDPKRDTKPDGTTGFADDVVIDGEGQLGLGIINPTAKLDIRGKFRFRDGNQANRRILLSNDTGDARWANRSIIETIEVLNIDALITGKTFITTPSYTGVSITLPEGTWQVMFQITCSTSDKSNMFWDLIASSSTYSLVDQANRRGTSAAGDPSTITAIYFVTNTVPATYYIWTSTRSGTATFFDGGTLWALPITEA